MANIDFKTGWAKYMNKKHKVDILIKDTPYKAPSKSIKEFAKGKSRRVSNSSINSNKIGLFKLSKILDKKYSFLTAPVKKVSTFTKEFWNSVFTSDNIQRINNSYKALIIQAINKGKYGRNKKSTIKRKGFDRKLIDTGQTMKAIKVSVKGLKK